MNLGDIAKKILGTVAPVLGTALGGPFGALAGGFLSKALGSTNAKDLEASITSSDPDILLKLKQADLDFQAKLKELGIDEEKLSFDDMANARSREIAVKDRTPAVLAGAVTIGFFSLLGLLCFRAPPVDSVNILNIMLGALGTAWIGIVNYYYGSSTGSADKSATIAKIASAK